MNWEEIVGKTNTNQYKNRLAELAEKGKDTRFIEETVEQTVQNLKDSRSLVIFGEPQSGKTEMMIALNAKLLDEDNAGIIVNLLTDSIDLLEQSLSRFRASGLNPSPKQFNELPHILKDIGHKKWVIFSKKNARDLEKLINLLRKRTDIIVIDDEADFASPNAKVNSDEKTKINQLIRKLLGQQGKYVGVTATPARLNLNNTFENDSDLWVNFSPHLSYVGQDFFFPINGTVDYRLNTFKIDTGSERKELEHSILHFLCGVAEQHERGHTKNFTMLVHTSGKRDEHENDIRIIQNTITTLSTPTHPGFRNIVRKLENVAQSYSTSNPALIVEFVLRRIDQHAIIEINSKGNSGKVSDIATPTSLFSFGAGGNIISRGVTFDNLLSMYFARAVKGKFSQDTYIQRARMFGSREDYKKYFQLWIPDQLLANWSKCFAFHKLAIQAMRSQGGAPIWLSDHKTTPTATNSIDKSTVDFESGEMSFSKFNFDENKHSSLMDRQERSDHQVLEEFAKVFTEKEFPQYLHEYLKHDIQTSQSKISFHTPSKFGTAASSYTPEEVNDIRRKKGIFANSEFSRSENPEAKHHLKIFFNNKNEARLFYKINGNAIKFIKNKK